MYVCVNVAYNTLLNVNSVFVLWPFQQVQYQHILYILIRSGNGMVYVCFLPKLIAAGMSYNTPACNQICQECSFIYNINILLWAFFSWVSCFRMQQSLDAFNANRVHGEGILFTVITKLHELLSVDVSK